MRNSVLQKRMPTLLGFILVGVGISLSSWFLQTGVLFPTEAGVGSTPQNVRISNVSDSAFTLSFTTTDAVIGSVSYGTTSTDEKQALDLRDKASGTPKEYTVHYIEVENLKPGTTYLYKIISGGEEYQKSGAAFTFITPGTVNGTVSKPLVISGQVQLSNDDSSGIVYASLPDSQVVSSLIKSDGTFSISNNNLRSKDFLPGVSFSESTQVNILVTSGSGSSKITATLGTSNPLPIVSLSQNYNFTLGSEPIGEFDASNSADLEGFPSFTVDVDEENVEDAVEITTPETNEGFSDQQPQFNGRALPNADVEVIVHSDEEVKATVKANSRGSWTFRPSSRLSPGEHTITIRTRDSFGILKEIQQSFVVYAEGSQFTDPSVSPVRTPTATRVPSPTPRVSLSPTVAVSPTPTLTVIPSPSPTLFVVAPSISPVQPVPDAGSPYLILSGLVGIVTLSAGLFVLFMSWGKAL